MPTVSSRRVVFPDGERPATIAFAGGVITEVLPFGPADVDCGDDALLPGLTDIHVHVNEPGRTHWEGFETATQAAAKGGVTTLIDMPLNSLPPTVDPGSLELKRQAAQGKCAVDVGFWGGAVPGNLGRLEELHEAGVFGFKCFLADSGVPEFPCLDFALLDKALAEVSRFDGLLIVHAESAHLIGEAGPRYGDFLVSRPEESEVDAVTRLATLARDRDARVHVLHVSSARAAEVVATAKRDGVRITAETCPHYLTLTAAQVAAEATEFKCCPPIRDEQNRERLWQALISGAIDIVVSDHSPAPPELKQTGRFDTAWGGIASLQLGFPLMWTEARGRGFGLGEIAHWMAQGPARIAGLETKGRIEVGCAADLVRFDTEAEFTVDPARLEHRHAISPYAGRTLTGVVRQTWLSGRRPANGSLLERPRHA